MNTLDNLKNLTSVLSGKYSLQQNAISCEEWDSLFEIAAQNWLIGSLGIAITSLPEQLKPPQTELIEFTQEVLKFQIQREIEIKKNIDLLENELSEFEPILWLKGADDLLSGISEPGNRWMMDIDVLIEEKYIQSAWKKAVPASYHIHSEEEFNDFSWEYEQWHHLPTIVRNNSNIAIEIHRFIGRYNTRNILPENHCLKEARTVTDISGQNFLVLNVNDGLIHRILHTQVLDGDVEKQSILPLRHLYNLYLYIEKNNKEIDWQQVQYRMYKFDYGDTFKRAVFLLGFLFAQKTPMYDESCSTGNAFLYKAIKQHSDSKNGLNKTKINTLLTIIIDPFSPATVHRKYGKKPNGATEWIKAYFLRFIDLPKKVFSLTAWKKRFRDRNKNNW